MQTDWNQARHCLCVRLDTLGDVVMTEPAIRAFKHAAPQRRITLLTSESGAAAAELIDSIDDVIVYSAPWMKSTPLRTTSGIDRRFVRELRGQRFDAAVIFTCFSQSPLPAAMLCHLADIPLRAAHCRENPYQLLTHWVRETEPEQGIRHEVERQLALVAALGAVREFDDAIQLSIPASAKERALRLLSRRGVDTRSPWFVMHVGATAPSRRWPPENFADLADRLYLKHGVKIVFTGMWNERDLIESVRQLMRAPSHSLVGLLDTAEMTGLLSAAPLLISNNTGPVHLAAGVGTPVVDLYALTNPQHVPWRVPSQVLSFDVPCRNCFRSVCPEGHHLCLRGVTVEDVVSAVEKLWHRPTSSFPPVKVAS